MKKMLLSAFDLLFAVIVCLLAIVSISALMAHFLKSGKQSAFAD